MAKYSTPLRCNLCDVKEGCRIISNHIFNASRSAEILLHTSNLFVNPELLRYAQIMNLIAYEELGKLFMLWQEAAKAERENYQDLEIFGFYNHPRKGEKAGELFHQMIDVFLDLIFKSSIEDEHDQESIKLANQIIVEALDRYKQHLIFVGENLKDVREFLMHTDFKDGKWTNKFENEILLISTDSNLFKSIAEFSLCYLTSGERFSTATQALMDMKESKESREVKRFGEILRSGITP